MKRPKKTKPNIEKAKFVMYGNMVSVHPKRRYEIVGKPTLMRRLFGYPFGSWDIAEIREVKDE